MVRINDGTKREPKTEMTTAATNPPNALDVVVWIETKVKVLEARLDALERILQPMLKDPLKVGSKPLSNCEGFYPNAGSAQPTSKLYAIDSALSDFEIRLKNLIKAIDLPQN